MFNGKQKLLTTLGLTAALFSGINKITLTAPSYPSKNITMVVPWNPGGGTDLTVRTLSDEMAKALNATISVVNTPGASGSIGTQNVWNAPHDGHTILGHGMMAFTSYPVMGLSKQSHKDWDVWIATFSPNVVTVGNKSKYKNMDEVMKAFKENPGKVKVGSAGQGSGGHIAIEALKSKAGIKYRHIPYEGGNKAIIAALSGEVDLVTQLLMEQTDMIKGKQMIPLAVFTADEMEIKGYGKIPSITEFVPEMKSVVPLGESFGIAVPKDTPKDVVEQIDKAFKAAVNSEAMKKFAEEKSAVILGYSGEEAQQFLDRLNSVVSWSLYEGGAAKKSPEEFNIPRP